MLMPIEKQKTKNKHVNIIQTRNLKPSTGITKNTSIIIILFVGKFSAHFHVLHFQPSHKSLQWKPSRSL